MPPFPRETGFSAPRPTDDEIVRVSLHTHRHHIRPPAARRRCYPTFSEVIQDLEAQGGRDISRYLAMNELYDKANGLRPILAPSLDDTDNKESGYSI